MRTLKILRGAAALLIGAAALVSCNNEEFNDEPGGQAGTGGDIRFEIGFAPQGGAMNAQADGKDTPQTRASTAADFTSAWEYGDEIGIFAVMHGDPLTTANIYDNIHNVRLTYDGTSWSLDNGVELWWPGGGGKLDFYAYHPYDPLANNPEAIAFNVLADQSGTTSINSTNRSNYNLSDLLTAKSDNSGNGWGKESTVSLQFSHALAMVQVSVPPEGKGFGPGKDLTVTLRGVKPGATLDLSEISATTAGSGITLSTTDAVNITMYRVEQPTDTDYETKYTYRALVPAQTVAEDNSLFLFEHEERQILTDGALAQAFQMTAGQAEKFERTLPATLLHTVPIPAGTFLMGSPETEPNRRDDETQHEVTLTKDFRMSKYQITNTQYAAFLNATGIGPDGEGAVSYYEDNFDTQVTDIKPFVPTYKWGVKWDSNKWAPQTGYENHPVIYVTWYGAKAYADWVGGTLPTEAQWEYACRGGSTESFGMGYNDVQIGYNNLDDYAWVGSIGGNNTHAVGEKRPNAYGLYDMHGNVREWCSDWYDNDASAGTDPPGPPSGIYRVLRGGSWFINAQRCRSAYRYSYFPDYWNNDVGFRVAFVP